MNLVNVVSCYKYIIYAPLDLDFNQDSHLMPPLEQPHCNISELAKMWCGMVRMGRMVGMVPLLTILSRIAHDITIQGLFEPDPFCIQG